MFKHHEGTPILLIIIIILMQVQVLETNLVESTILITIKGTKESNAGSVKDSDTYSPNVPTPSRKRTSR